MPSASTMPAAASTRSTSRNARTSRRRRGAAARSRKRLEVSLARLTAPPPILDTENLEPRLLELDDDVGEARDPAPGEHMPADEIVGLVLAQVADEVDQAEAAGLEVARVRTDQLGEAVAPGMLEAADR